uniref:RNA-guided endonuclease InsQ/TnpB family protein n=1 Tax=Escherichia coli TaxID=562 RepID=UPI001F2B2C42
QKQKKLIMLPSETMIWQPEFTDKTLSRKPGAVQGDAGWHSFITKLEYKAATKGVHLVKLDQWFASSKTCHCCGYKMPEMPLHKRIWRCPECGAEHDRDINAALNIRQKGILELKAAGLVVSAHGGQRKSVAQTVAA